MRTRKGSKAALVLAAAGSLVLSAAMSHAADISVGSATVRPDATGRVTVTLNVEAEETAVGTLTDMGFEAGAAVPARAGVAAVLAADITATATAIPVGDASDLQAFGTVQIGAEMIAYGEKRDNVLVAGGCVDGPSNIACLASGECGGGTCEPSGRGQGDTDPAPHSMNDGISTPTTPDCVVSSAVADLGKEAVFSYLPANCSLAEDCVPTVAIPCCDTVRGIVIALDDDFDTPFGTGPTDLYSCVIAAGSDVGMFPLVCADGQVSADPEGGLIATGSGGIDETCPRQPPLPPLPCGCVADGEVTVTDSTFCVGDFRDPFGEVTADEATLAVLSFGRGELLNPGADRPPMDGVIDASEATGTILNFGRGECNP